jgi:hypothetical protein
MAAEGGSTGQKAASPRKLAAEARLKAGPAGLSTAPALIAVAGHRRVTRERLTPLDWYARWLLAEPQEVKALDLSGVNMCGFRLGTELVLLAPVSTRASHSGSRHAPALPKLQNATHPSTGIRSGDRSRQLVPSSRLLSAWRRLIGG